MYIVYFARVLDISIDSAQYARVAGTPAGPTVGEVHHRVRILLRGD